MTKQLTAVFLSAVLLTGTASAAAWPAWAGDAENWAREHGLSDAFLAAPANQLTRAETARLLYEAAGTPSAGDFLPFDDVPCRVCRCGGMDSRPGVYQWCGRREILAGTPHNAAGICRHPAPHEKNAGCYRMRT